MNHNFFTRDIIDAWIHAKTITCMTVDWLSEEELPKIGPFPFSAKHSLSDECLVRLKRIFEDKYWDREMSNRAAPIPEIIIHVESPDKETPLFFYDATRMFFGYVKGKNLLAQELSEEGNTLIQANLSVFLPKKITIHKTKPVEE